MDQFWLAVKCIYVAGVAVVFYVSTSRLVRAMRANDGVVRLMQERISKRSAAVGFAIAIPFVSILWPLLPLAFLLPRDPDL